jgi:hypothetical protein
MVATTTLTAGETVRALERTTVTAAAEELNREPTTFPGPIAAAIGPRPLYFCTFCDRPLPELARLGPLRPRRRGHRRRARPRVYRC